jgi:glucuronoarabinoxylan endo-1,4-beta-xylanase
VKTHLTVWTGAALLSMVASLATACGPDQGPQTGSQTSWVRACQIDAECGNLRCLCGACTRSCDADATCVGLPGAACVSAGDEGSIALCGGKSPPSPGLCLPRCGNDACAPGQMCVAGACGPLPAPTVRVLVDTSIRHQVLAGFGATLAYSENDVVGHPRKVALYQAMFPSLGLDVLRLRNRYGYIGDDNLASASEIVAAAAAELGRPPMVLLTSWSPPTTLKASGSLVCQGNADTCTLAKVPGGTFDYAGYAAYWRAALDAYANAGVVPDYVGIQNNPDFVPTAAAPGEACRFLPTEGTATVSANGSFVDVQYPGFDQALTAVVDALVGLPSPAKIAAPETSGVQGVVDFAPHLDFSRVDAISHHMYGTDPTAIDVASLASLNELGRSHDRPLFQTEMQSDGFGTALSMHYALTVEGVSAYLQGVLAAPAASPVLNPGTLIALGADDFTLEDPYHAMRHYALNTDPGWIRVDAASDAGDLLASAWLSPQEEALTVVLVNAGTTDHDVALDLGARSGMTSRVTRTVFAGVERSAELGTLSPEGFLRVPGHAMVTVALRR